MLKNKKFLNNKGFAVSIILYSISTLVVIVLMLILAVEATNIRNTSNMSDKIKQEVSGLEVRS